MPDIALIELHDAVLGHARVEPNGRAKFVFEHLCVYLDVDGDKQEVWSYGGTLVVEGVHDLRLQGRLQVPASHRNCVLDFAASWSGEVVTETRLLEPQAVDKIEVMFGTRATLEISCRQAHIELGDQVRFLEHFTPRNTV